MTAGSIALVGMAAASAQAQTITISVDATAPGAPIARVWDFHGFDEANYSTSAEGRALLDTLGRIDPTPPLVRTHFLLNTGNGTPSLKWGSTNVYTEDAAGNPVYSWTITDQIMDAVTRARCPSPRSPSCRRPCRRIRLRTRTAARTPATAAASTPPKDYDKWSELIKTWAAHLNSRYPNVAQSWLWELWNEPDLKSSYFHGTDADYEKLYDFTEAALHQVMPTAKLGGPAVAGAGSAMLGAFLKHCATGTNAVTGKTGTRLDLVSFHAKGGAATVSGHVELNMGHQLTLHQTGFSAVAAIPAYKQVPIYVTEADPEGCAACPLSSNAAEAYRLSPAYGAYVNRDVQADARARDVDGCQRRRPHHLGFHFSGDAVLRGISRPRNQRHRAAGAGRVPVAGRVDGRAPARHEQRRGDAGFDPGVQRARRGGRGRHGHARRRQGARARLESSR